MNFEHGDFKFRMNLLEQRSKLAREDSFKMLKEVCLLADAQAGILPCSSMMLEHEYIMLGQAFGN